MAALRRRRGPSFGTSSARSASERSSTSVQTKRKHMNTRICRKFKTHISTQIKNEANHMSRQCTQKICDCVASPVLMISVRFSHPHTAHLQPQMPRRIRRACRAAEARAASARRDAAAAAVQMVRQTRTKAWIRQTTRKQRGRPVARHHAAMIQTLAHRQARNQQRAHLRRYRKNEAVDWRGWVASREPRSQSQSRPRFHRPRARQQPLSAAAAAAAAVRRQSPLRHRSNRRLLRTTSRGSAAKAGWIHGEGWGQRWRGGSNQ